MTIRRLLIANRGEVAIRIARTARELGLVTVGVHGEDEPDAVHLGHVDEVVGLRGEGPRALLDAMALVDAAVSQRCDALHPGYGLLSESPVLARACAEAGIVFVGPDARTLTLFGDKTQARALAAKLDVPVLGGSDGPCSVEDAEAFRAAAAEATTGPPPAILLKAVSGGGGRGLRRVGPGDDLAAAHAAAAREADAAFGSADLYAEILLSQARHVEVQIASDGVAVASLGDRECTLQRQHQKLVEMAPIPNLPAETAEALHVAAIAIARAADLAGLATVEFLVDAVDPRRFFFLEVNPRLQVEHTVTEEVTGFDCVALQLGLAQGHRLEAFGLSDAEIVPPRGAAVQLRINAERMQPDGRALPSVATVTGLQWPGGPGIRIDAALRPGVAPHPGFDSLCAKLIARGGTPGEAIRRARRALDELRLDGPETNVAFLAALLERPEVAAGEITTDFVETRAEALLAAASEIQARRSARDRASTGDRDRHAGARVDANDPLAVLDYGRSSEGAPRRGSEARRVEAEPVQGPAGSEGVPAPLQGTIVSFEVELGEAVAAGRNIAILEAMKMEHVVTAPSAGVVRGHGAAVGDTVREGHPLVFIEPGDVDATTMAQTAPIDLAHIRPDLQEVLDRRAMGLDVGRPDAVEKRHARGQRTARENVADLVDPDSFVEYGAFVVAAQRRRRTMDDLIAHTPADGMIGGIGRVNGMLFEDRASQIVIVSYDYMVLAGTQGAQNHRKKDRLFEIAERQRLPVVLFAEGGGGRPGDTDGVGGSGLDCLAFTLFAGLSGLVPTIGIASGRCFAGNAALLGCCDVVIATEGSNIGMGGPAMVEGGGLGVFRPDEIGPLDVQVSGGVVDIAVADEAEAVAAARKYLSYFQGPVRSVTFSDQRALRHMIPENRLRVYPVRDVVKTLCDDDSVLELRRGFGDGMVTALARIEGRAVGVIANDPTHLGGAIDSAAADKASRFMQLCDAHDLPIIFLCDTPGIMVGPEAEREATVRHASRMFVTAASLDTPTMTLVMRKGYGLGAQAMAGGSFKATLFTVAWPTGEFGGMGLEGAVKLGMRKELEAVDDPEERRALYEKLVARMYESGKAISTASTFEIDAVIDPAESRSWIAAALRSAPPPPPRSGKKRPMIDPW